MNKRSGISLVILTVTIVVALILLSIGIVTIDKNVDNAAVSGLMNDLKDVEDAASAYIIENGDSELEKLTYSEVIALLDEELKVSFIEELGLNSDLENKEFYKVDLAKIGVQKSPRGSGSGGENDIYVITKDTLHAYYLGGLVVNDVYYFSISKKINNL